MKSRPRTSKTNLYVVVAADGSIMQSLFDSEAQARRCARFEGDSVVAVTIDLSNAPIFIRRRTL